MTTATIITAILGSFLIFSSLGVVLARKPIYSSLSFLLTLISLAALYMQLSAEFIAVMQILVYAGAILVIFIFVIIIFQDAHQQISKYEDQNTPFLLITIGIAFLLTLFFLGKKLLSMQTFAHEISSDFGTVQGLGRVLYLDFFFPFEAIVVLFLIALIGTLFIAKKDKNRDLINTYHQDPPSSNLK